MKFAWPSVTCGCKVLSQMYGRVVDRIDQDESLSDVFKSRTTETQQI